MMTWHIELACDGSFGKEQGVRICGGKKESYGKLWMFIHSDGSFEINY